MEVSHIPCRLDFRASVEGFFAKFGEDASDDLENDRATEKGDIKDASLRRLRVRPSRSIFSANFYGPDSMHYWS